MKKILIIAALIFSGFLFHIESKTPNPRVGFGFFYSELSPHGTWIEFEPGLVVWRPLFVGSDWAPYSRGRWVWTEYGWYWDSYENFGSIVYHYGRWYYDDYYGWIWIPDYDWAPAWVEWRYDDYYIGWAPLPPYAVFSINIGIHFTYDYYNPYDHWHFVRFNNFCDPYVYNHYVGPKYRYRIFSNTKYRNDYGYSNGRIVNRGVDVDYVRKRSGQNIKQREIVRVNNPDEFGKTRDRNVIRGFMDSKDEILKRNPRDIQNVEIKRSERKSTLETNKVELGERKRVDREPAERKTEVIMREKSRNETIDVKNKNNNEKSRTVQRTEERIINRNNTQSGKEDRVRELSERKVEQRENPVIKRNENHNESLNNVNRQRTETQVQRNTERKVEVQRDTREKTEVQRNTQRKVETEKNVERNNSRTRQR